MVEWHLKQAVALLTLGGQHLQAGRVVPSAADFAAAQAHMRAVVAILRQLPEAQRKALAARAAPVGKKLEEFMRAWRQRFGAPAPVTAAAPPSPQPPADVTSPPNLRMMPGGQPQAPPYVST